MAEKNERVTMRRGLSYKQVHSKQVRFQFLLKTSNVWFGRRRSAGRSSFHNQEPAAVKLLSPNRLCVLGTESIRMSLEPERSGRRPISYSWLQSSRGTRVLRPLVTGGSVPRSWKWFAGPNIFEFSPWGGLTPSASPLATLIPRSIDHVI